MSNLQTTARFNPTSIPGCLMWVDATDSTTLTFSGTNVSQWNDKSGNGYNFTQPDTGRYPAYTVSGINSMTTWYFTGAVTSNGNS